MIVLSSNRNGNVNGVPCRDEDLLFHRPTTDSWQLLFDGSDVGLADNDVDAFTFLPNGNFLISVERDFTLASGYTVDGNRLLVDDADILEFVPTTLGGITAGKFSLYLDVSAAHKDHSLLYLSTLGNYAVQSDNALTGNAGDILLCDLVASGESTQCAFSRFWRGSEHGLGNWALDALYVGTLPDLVLFDANVNASDASAASAATLADDLDEADELDGFEEAKLEEGTRQIFLPLISR